MEIVQFLLDAKREKHVVWNHFHSLAWPPSFFTSEAEVDSKTPIARQGVVLFIIDCRSIEHARVLLKLLRTHLLKLYRSAGHSDAKFSVFLHKGERLDWVAL